MGNLVKLQLKTTEDTTIEVLNQELKLMGIFNQFVTNKFNQDWVDDINNNPEASQAHLSPITVEKLIDIFNIHATVGMMTFDVAFGRTEPEDAAKIAAFIEKNKDYFEYIDHADSFVERYAEDMTTDQQKIILALNKPYEEPELLPEEEQNIPTLQGGQFLCDSFSPKPFWVIFGKVDKPSFLKVKKYKNDLLNSIYRDKQGYAYLMMPLMSIGRIGHVEIMDVFEYAWKLGLRESPNLLLPLLYNMDIVNINNVAENFKEHYSDKIEDKFMQVFTYVNSKYPYGSIHGFIWSDKELRFKPLGGDKSLSLSHCNVLTALLMAMGSKKSAELMSKMTGKKYLPFEFKF